IRQARPSREARRGSSRPSPRQRSGESLTQHPTSSGCGPGWRGPKPPPSPALSSVVLLGGLLRPLRCGSLLVTVGIRLRGLADLLRAVLLRLRSRVGDDLVCLALSVGDDVLRLQPCVLVLPPRV